MEKSVRPQTEPHGSQDVNIFLWSKSRRYPTTRNDLPPSLTSGRVSDAVSGPGTGRKDRRRGPSRSVPAHRGLVRRDGGFLRIVFFLAFRVSFLMLHYRVRVAFQFVFDAIRSDRYHSRRCDTRASLPRMLPILRFSFALYDSLAEFSPRTIFGPTKLKKNHGKILHLYTTHHAWLAAAVARTARATLMICASPASVCVRTCGKKFVRRRRHRRRCRRVSAGKSDRTTAGKGRGRSRVASTVLDSGLAAQL